MLNLISQNRSAHLPIWTTVQWPQIFNMSEQEYLELFLFIKSMLLRSPPLSAHLSGQADGTMQMCA